MLNTVDTSSSSIADAIVWYMFSTINQIVLTEYSQIWQLQTRRCIRIPVKSTGGVPTDNPAILTCRACWPCLGERCDFVARFSGSTLLWDKMLEA